MKKIIALAMAGVMAAGMTSVAFAADPTYADAVPFLGYTAAADAVSTANVKAYVYQGSQVGYADASIGNAASDFQYSSDKEGFTLRIKGGSKIYIPIIEWENQLTTDGTTDTPNKDKVDSSEDRFEVAPLGNDNIKRYRAFADWKVNEFSKDSDISVSIETVKFGAGSSAVNKLAVVITVPDNFDKTNKDISGVITLAKTKAGVDNVLEQQNVKVSITVAPNSDGYDQTPGSYDKFDGSAVVDSSVGLVDFDQDAGEIDIEFADGIDVAMFSVDVTDQTKLNLAWNTKHDAEIAELFSDVNIDFLTFEGTPTFNKNGTLYIYADENSYIYGVTDKGLEDIKASYNDEYGAWEIRTRTLRSYAITDGEVDTSKTLPEESSSSSTESSTSSSTEGGKHNPDTGR